MTLTWSQPIDANGVVFRYAVQLLDESLNIFTAPNTLMHEFIGLTPNTDYVAIVRADTGEDGSIEGTTALLNFTTDIGSKIHPQVC